MTAVAPATIRLLAKLRAIVGSAGRRRYQMRLKPAQGRLGKPVGVEGEGDRRYDRRQKMNAKTHAGPGARARRGGSRRHQRPPLRPVGEPEHDGERGSSVTTIDHGDDRRRAASCCPT